MNAIQISVGEMSPKPVLLSCLGGELSCSLHLLVGTNSNTKLTFAEAI